MPGHEEINLLLSHIDTVLSEEHPLARSVSEATGLDAVVVQGNPYDTHLQGAMHAARTAMQHFGAKKLAASAALLEGSVTDALNNTDGEEQ
jgi:hypothetical protein